jgi:hypothetical protein
MFHVIELGVSYLVDLEFASHVQVLHHDLELLERYFAIVVLTYYTHTRSAFIIVLSTSCCSCKSVRLFPTIIFSTVNSSPLVMKPSSSMSYILKAKRSLCYSSVP